MKNSHSKKGFTLLELIVALAVFAVAITAALNSYLISIRNIQAVNEEKNCVLLSMLKIEEFQVQDAELRETGGSFPDPFQNYEWSLALSDLTIIDTEYRITFAPYKLTVKNASAEYSVITPFFKKTETETAEGLQ